MKLALAALAALCLLQLSSCYVWVRTEAMPSANAFSRIGPPPLHRNDVELAFGTPQMVGLRRVGDGDLAMSAYRTFAGRVEIFTESMKMESSVAWVAFDQEGSVAEMLHGWRVFDDPKVKHRKGSVDTNVVSSITLGVTRTADIEKALGPPTVRGRLFVRSLGVDREAAIYENGSNWGQVGFERLLIVGCDANGTIRDVLWTSSFPNEIANKSEISRQTTQQRKHLDVGGRYVYSVVDAISTSSKLDVTQVDALLRTSPKSVKQFTDVIGKPNAVGFKSFGGEEPLELCEWRSITISLAGIQEGPRPTTASSGNSPTVRYNIASADEARLIVACSKDGAVREVYWLHSPMAANK